MSSNSEEVIHGNICSLAILLTHSQQDIFLKCNDEIEKFIFSKKDTKNGLIQVAVI
jgi:hypothetical protein